MSSNRTVVKMLYQSLNDAFAPLVIASRVLGTLPVYRNKWRTFQAVVYFAGFVSNLVYFLQTDEYRNYLHAIDENAILFLILFLLVSRILTITYWFLFRFLKSRQFVEQLSKLETIERDLVKFDHLGHISKSTKSNRRRLTVLTVGLLLVSSFFLESVLFVVGYTVAQNIWQKLNAVVVAIYPRLVIVNLNLMFYAIELALEARFKVINNWMKGNVHGSNKLGAASFGGQIARLVRLHRGLVDVAKRLNSMLGFYILTRIAVCFVLVVGDLYFIIHLMLIDEEVAILAFVVLCTHVASYTLDLWLFAHQSQTLCNEANATRRLLVRISVDVEQEDVRNVVILESFKLKQNHLEIDACQLFPVNHSLLFAIWGAASSYLFIMIQLDLGSNNLPQNATLSALNMTSLEVL